MKKFIITEQERQHIKGLYEVNVNEGEEHEKKFNELSDSGVDPMVAYYKSQLVGDTTLYDLFKIYGEVLAFDLFDGDPNKFFDVIYDTSNEYNQKDTTGDQLFEIIVNYFCQGDEQKASEIHGEYWNKRAEKENNK